MSLARLLPSFRMVRSARGVRALFNTLIMSLPAIMNVGSLLLLLLFMFAILGMNLFGHVRAHHWPRSPLSPLSLCRPPLAARWRRVRNCAGGETESKREQLASSWLAAASISWRQLAAASSSSSEQQRRAASSS